MSRKTASFGQLIEYMSDIDKSDEQYNVYQNIFSHKAEDIEDEFQNNASLMAKRKNGNYMYHEILSISKSDTLEDKKQKEILRDIAYEYAQKRARHNLVFGTLHDDHDEHLHYHLLISANAVGDAKRTRLSKAEFSQFKKNLEIMVLKNYPELNQKQLMSKLKMASDKQAKTSHKERELKRRTGKQSQKDMFKQRLKDIFNQSVDKQSFFDNLSKAKIEIYTRGKTIGFVDLETGRKHRLKTLGFEAEFAKVNDTISKVVKKSEVQESEKGVDKKQAKNDHVKHEAKTKEKIQQEEKAKQRKAEMEKDRLKRQQSKKSSRKGRKQ